MPPICCSITAYGMLPMAFTALSTRFICCLRTTACCNEFSVTCTAVDAATVCHLAIRLGLVRFHADYFSFVYVACTSHTMVCRCAIHHSTICCVAVLQRGGYYACIASCLF